MDQQEVLGKAAKTAGIKLLVPSDFWVPTEDAVKNPPFAKERFTEFLKGINLPYVRVTTGIWPDYCLVPALGWGFDKNKLTFGGSGDSNLSFTHRIDVARCTAYVLTRILPSGMAWKALHIHDELITFSKIFAYYEDRTGGKLEVTKTPGC